MASLSEVTEKYDIEELREIIEDYVKETGSEFEDAYSHKPL